MKNILLIFIVLAAYLGQAQTVDQFSYYERIINDSYGDNAKIYSKGKTLRKFGRNNDLDTDVEEQIWEQGGFEIMATSNSIDTMSSSSGSDTQTVTIEGHYYDADNNLIFSIQTAILTGQTKVTLATPLSRATRVYNTGSTDLVGNVYVYEDGAITAGVPDDAATIHLFATAGNQQSSKAATSTSSTDYWVIVRVKFTVEKTQTSTVDFKVQIREANGVWRSQLFASLAGAQGTYQVDLTNTPIIMKPNSDIRVLGTSSTNNVIGGAEIGGFLAKVL